MKVWEILFNTIEIKINYIILIDNIKNINKIKKKLSSKIMSIKFEDNNDLNRNNITKVSRVSWKYMDNNFYINKISVNKWYCYP